MITVNVWDKALVVSVEKAIRASGLGLNPVVDGQNLRIPIPALTEERRKELVKVAHKYAEQQRVAVRNVRRDANDDLRAAEKAHVIAQDEEKRMEAEVQKLTDEANKRSCTSRLAPRRAWKDRDSRHGRCSNPIRRWRPAD